MTSSSPDLPLNNFSVELVDTLLTKIQKLLAPGGMLSFFEYVAIRRGESGGESGQRSRAAARYRGNSKSTSQRP